MGWPQANFGHDSNPGFDAVVDNASSIFDPARRRVYHARAYQRNGDDAAAILLRGALHDDLGRSFMKNQPVVTIVGATLRNSLLLSAAGLVAAIRLVSESAVRKAEIQRIG